MANETLEDLKKRLGEERAKLKENGEKKVIISELDLIDRQRKHPKLAAFAKAIPKFFSKLFSGLKTTGKGMGKFAEKLNEMDKKTLEERKLRQQIALGQQKLGKRQKPKAKGKPVTQKSIEEEVREATEIVPTY